jgi:hypothetical protein
MMTSYSARLVVRFLEMYEINYVLPREQGKIIHIVRAFPYVDERVSVIIETHPDEVGENFAKCHLVGEGSAETQNFERPDLLFKYLLDLKRCRRPSESASSKLEDLKVSSSSRRI